MGYRNEVRFQRSGRGFAGDHHFVRGITAAVFKKIDERNIHRHVPFDHLLLDDPLSDTVDLRCPRGNVLRTLRSDKYRARRADARRRVHRRSRNI